MFYLFTMFQFTQGLQRVNIVELKVLLARVKAMKNWAQIITMQSLYNTPHYSKDLL